MKRLGAQRIGGEQHGERALEHGFVALHRARDCCCRAMVAIGDVHRLVGEEFGDGDALVLVEHTPRGGPLDDVVDLRLTFGRNGENGGNGRSGRRVARSARVAPTCWRWPLSSLARLGRTFSWVRTRPSRNASTASAPTTPAGSGPRR